MIQRLYIDIDAAKLVGGRASQRSIAMPPFTQGDSGLTQRITLLKDWSGSQYANVATDGVTIQAALGLKTGDSLGVYYTQQFTWTAGGDLADPYFEAIFPLNTAGINTLLGTAAAKTTTYEVKMLDGGLPKTVLSKSVRVEASVIKDGGLQSPAVPTPISAETCDALFLQRLFVASEENPIVMRNGSVTVAVYVDTDGTFKTVRLT